MSTKRVFSIEQVKLVKEKSEVVVLTDAEPLFFSIPMWMQILQGGIIGTIANDVMESNLPYINQWIAGGKIQVPYLAKVAGATYKAESFCHLVTKGASEDMIVTRKGKNVTLKKGEKAKEGDICPILKDGDRIDWDSPIVLKISIEQQLKYAATQAAMKSALETVDLTGITF